MRAYQLNAILLPLSLSLASVLIGGCDQGEDEVEATAEATHESEPLAQPEDLEAATTTLGNKGSPVDNANLLRAWPKVDPGSAGATPVSRAVAVLRPTKGNKAQGTVSFETLGDEGVRVDTVMENLPPGDHGYHVHLLGDCTGDNGKTAGTHFNFKGPSKDPPKEVNRITGNLGELKADTNGHAEHSDSLESASLTGAHSIIGRSVIVHAKPNNAAEPPIGAAGARLACGVIGIDE